jgi:hypothetical protein
MALSQQEFEKLRAHLASRKASGNPVKIGAVDSTISSRVSSTVQGNLAKGGDALAGEGEFAGRGSIDRGFSAAAEVANIVPKVAYDVLPQPARKALDYVGEKVGQGFNAVTDKIASTDLFREIGELEAKGLINPETNPGFYKLKGTLNVGSASGQIAGDVLMTNQAAKVAQSTAKVTGKAAAVVKDKTAQALQSAKSAGIKVKDAAANPENIMQRVARISKDKQAKFEQVAGESVGKYLVDRNIYGNVEKITNQLYKRFKDSYQQADDSLSQLKGKFTPEPIKTALKELSEREARVSTPGAPSPTIARVNQLAAKKSWDMSEINEIKRLYERNVKVDYLKQNLPESVARANNIDSAIRNWQFKQAKTLGLKNLPEINRETQLAKQLMDALGKEYAGNAGNNAINLSDWLVMSGGDPTAIGLFITKKTLSAKTVQSAIAKKLSRGKGTKGVVKADMGPSEVRELPSGTTRGKVVNTPIKMTKKSQSTIDAEERLNKKIKKPN